jgi:hypothetical protein
MMARPSAVAILIVILWLGGLRHVHVIATNNAQITIQNRRLGSRQNTVTIVDGLLLCASA